MIIKMKSHFVSSLLIVTIIVAPSLGHFRMHKPVTLRSRDYEAKVMIFHGNPNESPQEGYPQQPQRLGQMSGPPPQHHATVQEVVDNIVKGLLKRKPTPSEIEAEKAKTNEAGLAEIHRQNSYREHQRQRAHNLLEQMRRARAERKKQQAQRERIQRQQQQERLRKPKRSNKGIRRW